MPKSKSRKGHNKRVQVRREVAELAKRKSQKAFVQSFENFNKEQAQKNELQRKGYSQLAEESRGIELSSRDLLDQDLVDSDVMLDALNTEV